MKPSIVSIALLVASTPALADDEVSSPSSLPGKQGAPKEPDKQKQGPYGQFGIGFGINPDDQFLFTATVRQPRLFGTHQGLRLDAEMSALRQRVSTTYDVPDVLGTGLDLRTEVYMLRNTWPTFTREAAGGEVSLSRRIDKATRVFTHYRVEGVSVQAPSGGPDGELPRQVEAPRDGSARLYTWLGAGIEYDTRDHAIPTRGTYLTLLGETSDPRLGSDAKLMRMSARLAHATPFGPFTLRFGGKAAYIHGPDGVPFSERLQYEGHSEVRGYGIGTLGDGGANFAASGKVELELPVIPSVGLSVAGFLDGAVRYNADPKAGAVGLTTLHSAGASIIWRSPIGALRFDWAQPLDGSRSDSTFLFSLGAGF
jgi:outer membrane protein insertion porin family